MKKRILYGVANYEEIVAKNGYFIDKTRYIPELEMIRNPVFLRPRRFVVDDIYADYEFDRSSQIEVHTLLRSHYNGYHFANGDGEAIYNPTLVTHFLVEFCESGGRIPEFLTDLNLRNDLYWVRRITTSYPGSSEEFVDGLVALNAIELAGQVLREWFVKMSTKPFQGMRGVSGSGPILVVNSKNQTIEFIGDIIAQQAPIH